MYIIRDAAVTQKTAMKGTGLGLISMHERIKLVNGAWSTDSQTKRGTIPARVPFIPGKSSTRAAVSSYA